MPLAPTRIIPITRKALFFDGVDDYAVVPDSPSISMTDALSILALIYPTSFDDWDIIVTKANGVDKGYELRLQNGRVELIVSDGTHENSFITSQQLRLNEWSLVSAAYSDNDDMARVGINTSFQEYTTDVHLVNYEHDMGIGRRYYHSWDKPFNGQIAYVLIYNRALSDDEIQQIYNDPDHPPKSGLVLWLHDTSIDTENNVWRDLSGNGNDATIYGATAVDVVRPATRVLDATRVIEPTR